MKKQGKPKRAKSKKRPSRPLAASPQRPRAVAGTVIVRRRTRSWSSNPIDAARHSLMHSSAVRVVTGGGTRDERLVLALLFAPFLIVGLWLGVEHAARQIAARAPQFIAAAQPPLSRPSAPAMPPVQIIGAAQQPDSNLRPGEQQLIERPLPADLPRLAMLFDASPTPLASLSLLIEPPSGPLPMLATLIERAAPPLPFLSLPSEVFAVPLPVLARLVEPLPEDLPNVSHAEALAPSSNTCLANLGPHNAGSVTLPRDAADFGRALSDAARAQLGKFVIYNNRYMRIGYPMGDVPTLFGVCTDVIVRAYRALGIDLQALIQETGSGRGDRNIDHRQVEVLRRFLAKHGSTLPISDLAEDYMPGDIVTYYRPQNRGSTSHIAMVTDQIAPSGRPMVVHNRGWGPELEDALFVDKITGHYRFTGIAVSEKSEPTARRRRVAGH